MGATTGTLALGWDIYKWSHRGARITVDVVSDMIKFGPDHERNTEEKFVIVTVCNTGDRPATITNMAGFWYRTWRQRLSRKPAVKFIVPMAAATRDQQIPYLLAPGARWMGMAVQDKDVESYLSAGRLEMGVYYSGSKKGRFRKVLRIPLQDRDSEE
jgi:hypothetical protein